MITNELNILSTIRSWRVSSNAKHFIVFTNDTVLRSCNMRSNERIAVHVVHGHRAYVCEFQKPLWLADNGDGDNPGRGGRLKRRSGLLNALPVCQNCRIEWVKFAWYAPHDIIYYYYVLLSATVYEKGRHRGLRTHCVCVCDWYMCVTYTGGVTPGRCCAAI